MHRLLLSFALAATAAAQPPTQKMVPPAGKSIPETDRAELSREVAELGVEIEALRQDPQAARLLPDVIIFHKAVDWALRYDEFMDEKHVKTAKDFLILGRQRAAELKAGAPSWPAATGLVVRGYVSRIDDSVQPYGLVVPADWKQGEKSPRRLDIWNHGRGDTSTELPFLAGRLQSAGEFTPEGALVLHPFGRFCNATKFAGETDVFEALEHVRENYPIDADRLVLRGFSMGGASTWHLGVHHASLWCALNPGAGFAETANYGGVFAAGKPFVPWWEQILWRWYDADLAVRNLANTHTIAYSGEEDKQRAAAEHMVAAAAREDLVLEHIIGPKTGHKYEPGAKKIVAAKVDALAAQGRGHVPAKVRFVTYTLRYPRMAWVQLDRLEKHWERAEVEAEIVDEGTVKVQTKNVAALTLSMPDGPLPFDQTHPPRVLIDGTELIGPAVQTPWVATFEKTAAGWSIPRPGGSPQLAKTPGLTGPIDDAFTDRFIFVRPTGQPQHAAVGAWAKGELERAIVEWRRVFRGDAIVKDDTAITDEDIAQANLILWGDPASNRVLGRVLKKLPLRWDRETVELAGYRLAAAQHAPVLIHPNPLNPRRYIVLNSSFTFRLGSRTSNSLQTPKLPDWALIDLRTPPNDTAPGLVYDAGFFDEHWQIPVGR